MWDSDHLPTARSSQAVRIAYMVILMSRSRIAVAVLFASSVPLQGQERRPALVPVFGVVLDAAGAPVEGAEVRAKAFRVRGLPRFIPPGDYEVGLETVGVARTNARGRFVLRIREARRFSVVAVHGETARAPALAPVSPGSQVELRLRPVRKVRGRLVETREGVEHPVGGVRVRSVGPVTSAVASRPHADLPFGEIEEVSTDANGEFDIRVFHDLKCRVETVDDGTSESVEAGGDGPVELKRYDRRASITFLDAKTGARIPRAAVHVAGRTFRGDAEGRCEARFVRSKSIDVEADGYQRQRLGMVLTESFDVKLVPGPRVCLQLVDARAKPCARMDVCVLRISHGKSGSGPVAIRVHTDDEGRLVLNRPQQFGAALWARVDSRFVRVCDVQPGTGDLDLKAVSTATFGIHGTVFDVDGVPATHVPVYAATSDCAFGSRLPIGQLPVAYTDHAGRFSIGGLARRPHALAARSARSLTTFGPQIVPVRTKPVVIHLRPAPLMKGCVIDPAGRPLTGSIVSASAYDRADERLRRFGLWTNTTRTDAKGEFALAAVQPGVAHRLSIAAKPGYSRPASLMVEPPDADIEIVVRPRR
jgi:hypothetical protein